MKNLTSTWGGRTERVSFCSVATEQQSIEIAGQILTPNEDTAYVEFYLSHAWPVKTLYRTTILPQVVKNSYATLNHKVFNLAHLMRKYNPEQNPRDRILGTVVAAEFTGDGIRAAAAMHKAAESVMDILMSWFTGQQPRGGAWSVSMENNFYEEEGGFLVKVGVGNVLEEFAVGTPQELRDQGYVFVPALAAPEALIGCLNNADDDERDGIKSARICRDYLGCDVTFALGGLDGKIRYRGVGLTPADGAREAEARVSTMLASAPMLDVAEALQPMGTLLKTVCGE